MDFSLARMPASCWRGALTGPCSNGTWMDSWTELKKVDAVKRRGACKEQHFEALAAQGATPWSYPHGEGSCCREALAENEGLFRGL